MTCWLIAGIAAARGFGWGWTVAGAAAGALVARGRPHLFVVAVVIGLAGGQWANFRETAQLNAALPADFEILEVVALSDNKAGLFGDEWALARPTALRVGGNWAPWAGPSLLLDLPPEASINWAERYAITGRLQDRSGSAAGVVYRASFNVKSVEWLAGANDPIRAMGNSLRQRVLQRLDQNQPEEALLAGFLVGETAGMAKSDTEALRAAGLSHFVAVSGSNVAGFLGLFWIVLGPLGVGARRRGVLGLVGLAVFAVATRWEPSVVRASLLAGVVLGARAAGLVVDRWIALSLGVGLAVFFAPDLLLDLGFQLSVAATSGIMLAADALPATLPRWLRKSLGVGMAAQVAAAPILLLSFGEIPLLSPITNLLAAPLVAAATLLAAIGVLTPFGALIDIASLLSGVVLGIGRTAAWYPTLTAIPAAALGSAVAIAIKAPRLRPGVALLTSAGLFFLLVGGTGLTGPAVAFFDVGQGDAALIASTEGHTILVDGGPDPMELWQALRRHGIRALDLVVATHPHDDHIGGLVGLASRIPIGQVWFAGDRHQSGTWEQVEEELLQRGVPLQVPPLRSSLVLGDVTVEVLGPERHYEDPNDESIVLLVKGPDISVLMTGDIEVAAQIDLEPVDIEILKVPHHGGATSSIAWLLATTPTMAVISVGEGNDFGHPHPSITTALSAAGIEVMRTDLNGDVVVALDSGSG